MKDKSPILEEVADVICHDEESLSGQSCGVCKEMAKKINKLYVLEGVEKHRECNIAKLKPCNECELGQKYIYEARCNGTGEIVEDILFEEVEYKEVRGYASDITIRVFLKPHLKDWKVRGKK